MTPGGFAAFVVRRRDRRGTRRTCLTGHRIMGAALALMLAASMQTGPVRAEPAGCAWTEWDFWDTATRADVTACIDAGADIEARATEGGLTPLHAAAARGTAETVKALIDAGADARARTRDGRTPADLAEDLENDSVLNDPVFRVLHDARFK